MSYFKLRIKCDALNSTSELKLITLSNFRSIKRDELNATELRRLRLIWCQKNSQNVLLSPTSNVRPRFPQTQPATTPSPPHSAALTLYNRAVSGHKNQNRGALPQGFCLCGSPLMKHNMKPVLTGNSTIPTDLLLVCFIELKNVIQITKEFPTGPHWE